MDVPVAKIVRNFHKTNEIIDRQTPALVRKMKPSCARGCAACCYQLVGITFVEAIGIADYILRERASEVPTLLEELDAASKRLHSNREEYMLQRRPCVFLAQVGPGWTGECSIYENRPLTCRLQYVVSDPRLCAPDRPYECTMVDTRAAHVQAARMMSSDDPLLMSYGPMAPLVAEAIRAIQENRQPSVLVLEQWVRRMGRMLEHDTEGMARLGLKDNYVKF